MSACMINNAVPVLNGQRALVTGASSGIGAGVARALGAAGAKVVVNYNFGDDQTLEVVTGIRAAGGSAVVDLGRVLAHDTPTNHSDRR
jgi:NAD(P)-dependent dehydrogenase (short-subunit alcohol dehydrogenase family)